MPEEFNSAYQPEVDKWIRSTLKKEELFELPKCTQDTQPRMPTPTTRTPANTNAFADDVAKTMIVKDPKDQAAQIRDQGKKFQIAMGNLELTENTDKQETMALFTGKNSRKSMLEFYNSKCPFAGERKLHVRYLGGRLRVNLCWKDWAQIMWESKEQ